MLRHITLGLIQGLTAFLPVSSSDHVVLVAALFGWHRPSLALDVLLHLGNLLAAGVYLRTELGALLLGVLGRGPEPAVVRRLLGYLAIGSLPAVALGIALGSAFQHSPRSALWVSGNLIVTALLLLGAERSRTQNRRRALDGRSALLVGVAEGAAIAPGISRSGSTIGIGLWQGLSRHEATRFSLLLALPVIAGAAAVSVGDLGDAGFQPTTSDLAGFLAASVSSYLAITALVRFVRSHSLRGFAVYLFFAASVAVALR